MRELLHYSHNQEQQTIFLGNFACHDNYNHCVVGIDTISFQ